MVLVIWTTSKQAYRYLYKNRIIPLPCESVLTDRLRHITLPPGFLDNCKDILTTKAEALGTPKNRVVQLSMDEVGPVLLQTKFSVYTQWDEKISELLNLFSNKKLKRVLK